MSYQDEYRSSLNDPETFWKDKAQDLEWFKQPETILSQDEDGIHHWFADGEMNTSYMALDYHVNNGRGDQLALIYDSPVTNTKKTFTYTQLRDEVALCAGMLKNLGMILSRACENNSLGKAIAPALREVRPALIAPKKIKITMPRGRYIRALSSNAASF